MKKRIDGSGQWTVGNAVDRIREEYQKTIKLNRNPTRPALWDGYTAGRCMQAILEHESSIEQLWNSGIEEFKTKKAP